jgi:predicted GTPase
MLIQVGASAAGAMSPDRIGSLHGRFMAAFSARMMAGLDKKLAQVAAKKNPAVAIVAPRPSAKPMSRAARLARAEAEEVCANQPRDAPLRLAWHEAGVACE